MLPVKKITLMLVSLLVVALVGGCSDSEPPNAPGKDFGTKKDYSKEDANTAQPVRGEVLKEKGQ
ncbi:MAG: hypothetical protein SFX74_12320 [Fimbriimonadaceae bacterium]|nr:hypothetical protein [Fimbriimonadaceae bacterium]